MKLVAQILFVLGMLASLAAGFSVRLDKAMAWAMTAVMLLIGAAFFAVAGGL